MISFNQETKIINNFWLFLIQLVIFALLCSSPFGSLRWLSQEVGKLTQAVSSALVDFYSQPEPQ